MQIHFSRLLAVIAAVALSAFSATVAADPPARVARLGYVAGAVSFSPAGESDWDPATVNRPLGTGDRLWTDGGARSEIEVGGTAVRMGPETGVSVLNLDDRIMQLQLTEGTLNVRVRRIEAGQVVEVDTPNLAFSLRRAGEYRISVDPDGGATTVVVRKGQGDAYGEGAAYVIDPRQAYRFTGTGLREYEAVATPRADDFDRWAGSRDRRYDHSRSASYVSADVVGYQELDAHGSWRDDPGYGHVWTPNRVAAGWAPYRDGHWAWVAPWGWTWVDDAPWGFAVSHYGRWASLAGRWAWVPGPARARAYYAPALVGFVGGDNFQVANGGGRVDGVGWFPLAPREVYRPAYPVSRGYYERLNRSNTVINTTVINNTYNTYNTPSASREVHANRQVRGAVVALPASAFLRPHQVAGTAPAAPRQVLFGKPVAVAAPAAPSEKHVRGAEGRREPPPGAFARPVVARNTPAAAHAGGVVQPQSPNGKPGRPHEGSRGDAPAAAPVAPVRVLAGTQAAPTRTPPPLAAPRERGDSRRNRAGEAPAAAPVAAAAAGVIGDGSRGPGARPGVSTPAAGAAAPPPEQRGRPEHRGRGEARGQTATPPPAQAVAPVAARPAPTADNRTGQGGRREHGGPPPAAPPPRAAVAVAPAVTRAEHGGRPPQAGTGAARGQAQATPPAAPSVPATAAAAPGPWIKPVPDGPPSPQRGNPEQRGRGEARQKPAAAVPPPAPAAVAPPVPAPAVAPAQRPNQPRPNPPVQAAPPESAARPHPRPAKPDPAAAPRAPAPGVPGTAEKPPPAKATPHGKEQKPDPARAHDKRKGRDDQDEEDAKHKK